MLHRGPSLTLRINLRSETVSSISVSQLITVLHDVRLLDVRKPKARATSGQTIPGSTWFHPFGAERWLTEIDRNAKTVVFCVHGHEVSQAVHGFLRDAGIDAHYLEGGFEAWKGADQAIVPIETQSKSTT